MATELKAKLLIEAKATGSDEIEALAQEMERIGEAGQEAAPRAQLLAAELRALGQQSQVAENFARLKRETENVAAAMDAASSQVDKLGAELSQVGAAAEQAAAAQARAGQELADARQWQAQLNAAIAQTRKELVQEQEALRNAGQDSAMYAERVRDGAAQLKQLQAEQRESVQTVKLLAAAYKESEAATRTAQNTQKQLASEYQRAVTSASQLSGALGKSRAELQGAREAMTAVGVSTNGLADSQSRVRAEIARTSQQANNLAESYRSTAQEASKTAATQTASHRQIGEGVRSISKELALLRNGYLAVQGVMGAVQSVKGLADTADAVNNLQARIKLAVGDASLFDQAWKDVTQTAIATNSSLEATGTLFSRLAAAGRDAGLSAQQAAQQSLAVTKTINQAVRLSGASIQASDAALTQLIQGLQSGVLRGEEFNSVMEQSPRLARALADGLGVTIGRLREMAEAGDLTAGTVINALKSQAETIEKEFATLPKTVGAAVQNLSTAWSMFVNETDKSYGASARLAGGIQLLADNLKTVADVAAAVGQALLVFYAGKALMGVRNYAAAQLAAAQATQQVALASTQAGAAAGQASRSMDQAAVATTRAGVAAAGTARSLDQVAVSGGRASAALTVARGAAQQFGGLLRTAAYVEIAVQVAQITKSLYDWYEVNKKANAIKAETVKKDEQIAQKLREISEATGIAISSMEELNAAQAAGKLVFNDMTGQWQAASASQAAFAAAMDKATAATRAWLSAGDLVRRFNELNVGAEGAEKAIKNLAEAFKFNDVSRIGAFAQALDTLAAKGKLSADQVGQAWELALAKVKPDQLDALRGKLEEAAKAGIISAGNMGSVLEASFKQLGVNAAQAMGQVSDGAAKAIAQLDLIAQSAKSAGVGAQEAARGIEMAFLAAIPKADSLEAITSLQERLKAMGESGQIGAEGVKRISQALDEQKAKIEDQLPGIQSLEEALTKAGVNGAQALGQIGKGAQGSIDAISQVAEAARAAGVSVEAAARSIEMAFVAAIPKADSLEAITALETKLKEMGKAGEISAQGMERVQAALDKQKVSIEGQIPGIQSLQEALRELGVKPQAELDALAKKAKAAFDVIKASGTATPREVSEAWKAMAEASIAANNGVADAVLQAQASQHGFVIETDKAGKAIVKSMQEAAEATKGVGDAAKAAGEAAAEGAAAAGEATDRFARDASGQILKLEGTWLDAEAAASNYSAQVAEMVYSLNKPLELMRQEHLAMVRSLEALDAAQQRLQSNGASSVDDLRLRLLELNGTEEQIAEARQRREIAEVERNKRLMEIQLKRARMLGNEEDVAAAEFELQMLNEQLKLLEQIHKEEDKQRDAKAREAKRQQEEREREERERASRDASGGSSGSSSTSAVDNSRGPVTFSPTFNAYGITDPVLLARQMAPVFEKMARLTR